MSPHKYSHTSLYPNFILLVLKEDEKDGGRKKINTKHT